MSTAERETGESWTGATEVAYIWHGTACVELMAGSTKLLIDPFVPWRGSPAPVKVEDFDGCETILVTHGHFDHIASLPKIVKRNPNVRIYATRTPISTLLKKGVPRRNLTEIAAGVSFRIGEAEITAHQSRHAALEIAGISRALDPRMLRYAYNLPYALYAYHAYPEREEILLYEIRLRGRCLLVMGSMNLPEEVLSGSVRGSYPDSADVLFLPYVGYRDNLAQARKILERLQPRRVVLTHFDDTFPPLTKEVEIGEILAGEPRVVRPRYGEVERVVD